MVRENTIQVLKQMGSISSNKTLFVNSRNEALNQINSSGSKHSLQKSPGHDFDYATLKQNQSRITLRKRSVISFPSLVERELSPERKSPTYAHLPAFDVSSNQTKSPRDDENAGP